jgi:hypothetical protein
MNRLLLDWSRSHPESDILYNCDPRLGCSCMLNYNELSELARYYGITNEDLLSYDIRDSSQQWEDDK